MERGAIAAASACVKPRHNAPTARLMRQQQQQRQAHGAGAAQLTGRQYNPARPGSRCECLPVPAWHRTAMAPHEAPAFVPCPCLGCHLPGNAPQGSAVVLKAVVVGQLMLMLPYLRAATAASNASACCCCVSGWTNRLHVGTHATRQTHTQSAHTLIRKHRFRRVVITWQHLHGRLRLLTTPKHSRR